MIKTCFHFAICILCIHQSIAQSGWDITTNNKKDYYPPITANGMIGILPSPDPLKVQRVMINGLYDKGGGRNHGVVTNFDLMNAPQVDIQLAKISKKISTAGEKDINFWKQSVHLKKAEIVTSFQAFDKLEIEHRIVALRHLPFTYLTEITITSLQNDILDITISVDDKEYLKVIRNNFFRINKVPILEKTVLSPDKNFGITMINSVMTNDSKIEFGSSTSEFFCGNSIKKVVKKNEVFTFTVITSICTSAHFDDYINEAIRCNLFAFLEGKDKLISRHREEWSNLWKSDIILESNDPYEQLDIRHSLYNLYSYIRPNSVYSIPPMGLYSSGYSGHIFWDAEIWMFPPLLLLQPEMARSMLEYRYIRLDAAKKIAMARGFKGAMFPWESAITGYEETPVWALTGPFEHHVTADVGIAFWNYYLATSDKDFLKDRAYPVLKEIAEFWISRVEINQKGEYEIKNVVCPDEFAEGVDNNAFTNASAITVLQNAISASEILNIPYNPLWKKVSEKIPIRQFSNGVTREHETYNGEIIKQADVNLLAFPLKFINEPKQIEKDLDYYSPKVTKDGPAMTHGIFSVIESRLGNCEKAYQYFKDSYLPNKKGPFGVLAESQKSNNPYFATGAGAMLQAVLFGFAGLDFDATNGIFQTVECLPDSWKSLTITGVGPQKKTFSITKK